jgi:anti-sigma factor RsiW
MSETPIDPRLIMHAALDGELDATGQIAFERTLDQDPALAADYARLLALRGVLRAHLPREMASAALRRRIQAQTRPRRAFFIRGDLLAMAASLLLGIFIGGGTMYWRAPNTASGEVEALISDHRRALLAEAPYDVALNERHNLRPWFDARIAISPPVPDLSAAGFPLIGGRVDVIGGIPVPVMVYRIREHVVSVTAQSPPVTRAGTMRSGGYHVVSWRGSSFAFWAVSDADEKELDNFVHAFQAAESAGTEKPAH